MKWFFIVKRNYCLLWASLTFEGYKRKYFKNIIGYDQHYSGFLYFDRDWSVIEREFHKEIILTGNILRKNPELFLKASNNCEKNGEDLVRYSKKISKLKLQTMPERKLVELFEQYAVKHHRVSVFLQHTHATSKNLEEIIRKQLRRGLREKHIRLLDEHLSILTFPVKLNYSNIAEKELLKLAILNKKGTDKLVIKNKIKNYIENYGWMETRDGISPGISTAEVKKRYLIYKNPNKELSKLSEDRRLYTREFQKLIEFYKFNKIFQLLLKIAKEYVYLRTYRTDVLNEAFYRIRPLLTALGKYYNLDYKQISFLTHKELINIKSKPIPKNIIKERMNCMGYLVLGNKETVYQGKSFKVMKKKTQYDISKVDEIKGTIGYQGKIIGRVFVALSAIAAKKIRKNDILVTSMTTPDFTVAMKKSSALVTDEGGITCHAAIIARELKKPCIIGTKIATKVLITGDRIEVDADKGIIRKIK